MNEDHFWYVASKHGAPGYCAGCVDDPNYADDTAEWVADRIRNGYAVHRVTHDQMSMGMQQYGDYRDKAE